MKYNKGFLGIVITIIVSLVVGGGVVYYVTKTKAPPLQNVIENSNQINEQNYNPSVDNKKNPPKEVPTASTACNSNSPSRIKLLSPNGGETYSLGSDIKISWTGCNNLGPTLIRILSYDTASGSFEKSLNLTLYDNFYINSKKLSSSGSVSWTIPNIANYVAPSVPNIAEETMIFNNTKKYKISVAFEGPDGYFDMSDDFFTIKSQNIPILTQEEAKNLVYKKWGDCSQGDCGGVVVTLSQNNIGQYVVTAIFTQLDDSTSQSKRISIASYQNGTWTLGQPVVTQMCHRGNADGTTGWTAGLCI